MRSWRVFLITLIITAVVLAGCGGSPSGEEEKSDTIKIGFSAPLSGSSAELGQRALRGVILAAEEVNAAGGINGKEIVVVEMDDRADPKEAANVANLFVSDPDILAVIGHNNSSCTLAAAPIYNKGGLPHISPDSSSPKISECGPYTFRVRNSDAYTGAFNVEKMHEAGYKKLGILYENNDFGRGGMEVAVQTANELGLEPPITEAFMLGETKDFSTAITKFKQAGTEAIYMVADYTEIALFAKQAHQMGFRPSIWGGVGAYNPAIITIAGEDADGIVGSTVFYESDPRPEVQDYVQKFLARYESEGITQCDAFSPCGYDALRLLAEAIKENGEDRDAISDHLSQVENFPGAIGEITFDENGDVHVPLKLLKIENGDFVPFEVGQN